MKKTTILSAALALVLSATGCYDLERYPSDQLSSGTFWKTQSQADMAMMGTYSIMQRFNVFGIQPAMDNLGGIGLARGVYGYQPFVTGTYDVTNSYVSGKWSNLYEGIARCNIALQNLDQVEMSDALKAQYKGEAHFLRGLYYFSLLDFFGGVPIYDESTILATEYSEMKKPRSSADEVRKFVLDDFEAAFQTLPEAWDDANTGRATKYAALAFKGKVYLYNKQYTEAKKCFEDLIETHKYELYPDYAGLFVPGGDESSEMIFAIQNMGGVGTDYGMPLCFYMGTRASFGSCWNNVMASVSFVDSYEYKDGRPFNWDELFPGFSTSNDKKKEVFNSTFSGSTLTKYPDAKPQLLAMYDQRDPRMKASIILPYTQYLGWYSNAPAMHEYVLPTQGRTAGSGYIKTDGNFDTYLWRKFVPEGNMDGQINNREDTPINFPLMRYADVLLMLAECKNELNDQEGAVALINEVRNRPTVEMPALNSGPAYLAANTKEEVFQRIRHERAVELAAEGHSFSDMKRWGLLNELNGRNECHITGKVIYTRVVTDRDYLWPIPSAEIEKNPALAPNNPGW